MEQRNNIVLIGMPGSGKTTVGKLVAKALQKTFVDMDQAIEADQQTTVADIFAQKGEAEFRRLETAKAKELSQQTDLVIATGGGAVTGKENMDALCRTGLILFLDRPLEQLLEQEQDGTRPLLAKDRAANLKKLYIQRISLYETYCDRRILNDTTAEDAAEKILQIIKETGGTVS